MPWNLHPPHHIAAPGESGTEAGQNHDITVFHLTCPHSLIQSNAYGSGRSIAETIHVYPHMVCRHLEPLGNGLDNAVVCLVGNEHINIVLFHSCFSSVFRVVAPI